MHAHDNAEVMYVFSGKCDVWAAPEGEERERRVRRRLTLRASRDWGRTWSRGRVLCEGASGYSALALDGQGNLCCLYETWEDAHLVRLRLLTVPARELEELFRD